MNRTFRLASGHLLVATALSLFSWLVEAHEYRAGALKIVHPFAAPSPLGATNGAAFIVRIENSIPQRDRLIRVSSPIASKVLLHRQEITSAGMMRMREVLFTAVESGTSTDLGKESGYHLMMHELRKPLVAGDRIAATLYFEQARPIEVVFVVAPSPAGSATNPGHHMVHDHHG